VTKCKAVHRNRDDDPVIGKSNICPVTRLWVGRPTERGPTASSDNMFFCTPKNPDQFQGPPKLIFNMYREVQLTEREGDHAPPTSAEVNPFQPSDAM
jgi:hypothetical protein